MIRNRMVAYWHDLVSREDIDFLGVEIGNPAFQSELELLAVLVSLVVFEAWAVRTDSEVAKIVLGADNTSTLLGAMNFQASSPLMASLVAEVALRLAVMEVPHLWAHHVPGSLNTLADCLSRLKPNDEVPNALRDATKVAVPARNQDFYKVIRRLQ